MLKFVVYRAIDAAERKEIGLPPRYFGLAAMRLWPLDFLDDPLSEALWHERQEELYPLQKEAQIGVAVSDGDYIRRYLAACGRLVGGAGVLALYNRPEEIEANRLFRVKRVLGAECVNLGYDLVSYLYSDYAWEESGALHDELRENGLVFNENGLFSGLSDAEAYGALRRRHLNAGEQWEDCGPERAVMLAECEVIRTWWTLTKS